MPVKQSKIRWGYESWKDEYLIDGGKSAMMTIRRRPLADRSRLKLQQPERHACRLWAARLGGWYLLTAEFADLAGQRRRQEVPDIAARCREALWTLAPPFCTARVLGHVASAVSPTHQRYGRAVADGSWVVPQRWAPTAKSAYYGRYADQYCIAVVESRVCTKATTSIWNVAVGTTRRIWSNWRIAAKHSVTVRLTCARIDKCASM